MCVKTCAPENMPYQQVMASGSIVNAYQGPAAGFHVARYIEGALVGTQGDIAAVTFAGPPRAAYIPLLDYLTDRESLPIPNEDDGAIAMELNLSGKSNFTGPADTF